MNYKGIANSTSGLKSNKTNVNQLKIEQDKKDKGMMALKKGQLITGQVVSVGDQVILNFYGQEVISSKSVLSNVIPGEVKTFEVVKANGSDIELRIINEIKGEQGRPFKATITSNTDWNSRLEHKKKNADETEKAAQDNQIKEVLNKVNTLITQKDCDMLEREGFKIEDYTISGLYEALKRVKKQESEEPDSTKNKIKSDHLKALEQKLEENNLPASQENISLVNKAIELSSFVASMNDKSMHYLISTNAVPSAENIYKAYYSQAAINQGPKAILSKEAWKELQGQVADVIQSCGYEVNEQNLNDAKWLIENHLPLNIDTFTYKKNLDEMKANIDQNTFLNKMIRGMKEGINPKDVSLAEEHTTDLNRLIEDVKSISNDAVTNAVQNDEELTIKRLKTIQEGLGTLKIEEMDGSEEGLRTEENISTKESHQMENSADHRIQAKEYEEIKAKRLMEEIRLKMTIEAAGELEKRGIKVDSQELEKVVENLRRLEEEQYKKLLREADMEQSDNAIALLKETSRSVEALKKIPISALGRTLTQRTMQTITSLVEAGTKLQSEYRKAGMAYETVSTVPNVEYGDSIKKAFDNAKTLLTQIGMEGSEQNQRAVRILGYNRMEITEDNINRVNAYDTQVTALINNLNPAVVVRMIKEGMNPLDMTIGELNKTIDQVKEEYGINSEDKYSVYLNQLEKQNGITSQERKAYIGIYRLLYNIEKSDGAVVGSVVHANREVTLSNLLTALQTSKKGSMDAIINDEFGTLQEINHMKESISSQLKSFSAGETGADNNSSNTLSFQEQTEYMDRILKQLTEEVTPKKLMKASTRLSESTSDGSNSSLTKLQFSSERGVWDNIKDIPAQKLIEYLRQGNEGLSEDGAYTEKINELRALCKNAEQSIRFLREYKIPSTTANMTMANQILSNGDSSVKRFLNLENKRNVENSKNDIKNSDDLSDKLIDKQTMGQAYEQIEAEAKSALVEECSGEQIDRLRLTQLRSIGQQITFARTLAQKEFYQIPIETEGGITNVNLTILRGLKESGRVSVGIASERLGNVKAEFALKDDIVKGFVTSDKKDSLEHFQTNMEIVEQAVQEYNVTLKQIDYGILQRDSETNSILYPSTNEGDANVSSDTEKILYRIAKAFIQTIRMAESNKTEGNRAVS